jgi:putative ABC transport system substrate-binding protein
MKFKKRRSQTCILSSSPHRESYGLLSNLMRWRPVWRRATCRRGLTFIAVVISLLELAVIAAPLVPQAQAAGTIPRVGVIGEFPPTHPFIAAFRQGLRELGYIEGQSILVEYRNAQGALDRVPSFAAELIRLKVDILVVGGTMSAQLAKLQTTMVPIVFVTAGDPVSSGLVASLARPGGNATGMSILVPELSGKQLELLKAVVPQISRITILYNPLNPAAGPALNAAREAARVLAVELQVLEVRQPNEVPSAFSSLTGRTGALLVLPDPVLGSELAQISKLAAQKRLPAMYLRREFAEAGGLLAYGPSFSDNYRRAATYVDKILKGAKPADLPVQQPIKFDLIINRRTAKALGLTIPQSLLLQADQIIE